VTVRSVSGLVGENKPGQAPRRRHQLRVGVGDSESTPAETALAVDTPVSAKRVRGNRKPRGRGFDLDTDVDVTPRHFTDNYMYFTYK
jgi:hypothetical protein